MLRSRSAAARRAAGAGQASKQEVTRGQPPTCSYAARPRHVAVQRGQQQAPVPGVYMGTSASKPPPCQLLMTGTVRPDTLRQLLERLGRSACQFAAARLLNQCCTMRSAAVARVYWLLRLAGWQRVSIGACDRPALARRWHFRCDIVYDDPAGRWTVLSPQSTYTSRPRGERPACWRVQYVGGRWYLSQADHESGGRLSGAACSHLCHRRSRY